jgi:hypothetical protein
MILPNKMLLLKCPMRCSLKIPLQISNYFLPMEISTNKNNYFITSSFAINTNHIVFMNHNIFTCKIKDKKLNVGYYKITTINNKKIYIHEFDPIFNDNLQMIELCKNDDYEMIRNLFNF